MAKTRAQQAAIAISMKSAGKKPKSLTKAQKGITVKPTADSTAYYKRASESFMRLANSENKKGNEALANKLVKLAKSSFDDQQRQSKKGKPGYDKNGFPIKKSKGGIAKMAKGGSTPAWTRSEGKNPEGGLNAKGVASYRKANPGSKLKMAVTTKPSKLDPDSKDAKRRKSFCARMSGVKGPMKDEKGRPTRKALSLRKWNC